MADVAVMPQINNHGTNFEQQHVQHVYDEIAASMNDTQHKAWPNVKRFLKKFPPGSLIADIGCGNGRYLNINKSAYKVGVDVCTALVNNANSKGYEVAYADNLNLPFRDETFDGVVSIGVIHHFCSVERRTKALQELARVLRPGGRAMLYVWALEQKHRKFDSQDVLIPWRGSGRTRPVRTGSCSSFGPSSASSVSEDEAVIQSTENNDKQTIQNSPRSLRRHSSLSADDISSLLELSDFKPNYYSLDFSASPQHRKKETDKGDGVYTWNQGGIRGGLSNTKSDKLIKECRKFEASLRAMSSDSLDLLEAKCMDEKFALKINDNRNDKQTSVGNVNCIVNELGDETGTVSVNGVEVERELDVNLDWAVGDLENDDFEAEIPNPSAIYDSGFIENGLNNEQDGYIEQEYDTEPDKNRLSSKKDQLKRHGEGESKRLQKMNPFLKQNSLDPYTFNNVKRGNSCTSDDTSSIEVINENQEELQEVFVKFKPHLQGDIAKKSERSFFSGVKSKLLQMFDDKRENKNGRKKSKAVNSDVATTHVQGPVSPLSEEQLDLAEMLNFKVREFPLSSCADVLKRGQGSPHIGAQSNRNKELDNGSQISLTGTEELRENCKRQKELFGTGETILEEEILREISSKVSVSRHRCYSESRTLNGIYDGYIKIDVDRLCYNREDEAVCVQSSAFNNKNRNIKDTLRSHSVDAIDYNFDSNTREMSTATTCNETCNNSTEISQSHTSSSQNALLQQVCKEFDKDHKISRINSYPSDQFRLSGNSRNECNRQGERIGFHSKDDDSVFEIEDEELSSKLYRYYHVFRKGEMEKLISNHVTDLHIVQCFYDHANWCIVAEKL